MSDESSVDFDWSGFAAEAESEDLGNDIGTEISETEVPTETQVEAKTEVPTETVIPTETQVQTQVQPEPQQQILPQTELPKQSKEELATAYEQQLAQYYSLTEEDAIAFTAEPAKFLPALAARLHRSIFDQMQSFVAGVLQHNLPLMISHHQVQNTRAQTENEVFFSKWPELKGQEKLIVEAGKVWRTQNPSAPYEQFVEKVGSQVWIALGKPVDQLVAKLSGGNQQQSVSQNGAPQANQKVVVDRMPTTSPIAGTNNQSPSLWAQLIDED